jgi:ABC-type branched-subunit amino acid transport system ATPase component
MAGPLLSAQGLQVRYRDGALGIIDISLKVNSGETVALLGPNGAGKTTTLRALSGFLGGEGARITKGMVTFDGRDITNFEPHRAARLGVVCIPERKKIFPNLSVMENLQALGRTAKGEQRGGLQDKVFELFPILAERRHQAAGRLSGGQQQMLAIGRGLMSGARLLLLDEMTLGLHVSVKPILYDAVVEINRGGTAVLISDESADLALSLCKQCYLIRDGLISDSGTPDQFAVEELATGYLG